MVPFNQVLKLVARLDSQRLANLSWNGCLSLTRYRGMLHRFVSYSLGIPYILIIPYFTSRGKQLASSCQQLACFICSGCSRRSRYRVTHLTERPGNFAQGSDNRVGCRM